MRKDDAYMLDLVKFLFSEEVSTGFSGEVGTVFYRVVNTGFSGEVSIGFYREVNTGFSGEVNIVFSEEVITGFCATIRPSMQSKDTLSGLQPLSFPLPNIQSY